MNTGKTRFLVFVFVIAIGIIAGQAVFADTTISYPSKDKAVFSVTSPDSWEMQPGEDEGDYFTLTGPTGAMLSFRAIPGTKDDLNGAIQSAVDYLKETYNDVKMGEAQDIGSGVDGFYSNGTGKDKEDGTACNIHIKWMVLKSGNIAEIWYEAASDDKEGTDEAVKILNTFKAM